MSRAEAISDDEDGGELVAAGDTRTGRARGRARSLILYVGLPLLLMGGGGGLWLAGWPGAELLGLGPSAEPSAQARPVVFHDLPKILVNLSRDGDRIHYLKLKVSLETSDPSVSEVLDPMMPRIMDVFQVYLRELRPGDLEGSAGIYRLKSELLRRINLIIEPKEVDRILFREIIIQ